MKSFLIRALLRLARCLGWRETPIPAACALAFSYVAAAEDIVAFWEAHTPGAHDEFKHSKAYRQLVERFPRAPHRVLGLALELAVQRVKA